MLQSGFIDEVDVELEFGGGKRHVDIRFGILNYGVLDKGERLSAREITIGVVGDPVNNDNFLRWLTNCCEGVDAKETTKPNLFPRFPGFGPDSPFNAVLKSEVRGQRNLDQGEIAKLKSLRTAGEIVGEAVNIYRAEIDYLVNEIKPEVIFRIVTDEISDELNRAAELGSSSRRSYSRGKVRGGYCDDFHHLLKAKAMCYHVPIQLVLPATFGQGHRGKPAKRKRPSLAARGRALQDPATRAWNLFTAMYYKAGGVPWRLPRESSDYTTCYVGVSFYNSLDQQTVLTSIAQVFNERGEGIVVRGA